MRRALGRADAFSLEELGLAAGPSHTLLIEKRKVGATPGPSPGNTLSQRQERTTSEEKKNSSPNRIILFCCVGSKTVHILFLILKMPIALKCHRKEKAPYQNLITSLLLLEHRRD